MKTRSMLRERTVLLAAVTVSGLCACDGGEGAGGAGGTTTTTTTTEPSGGMGGAGGVGGAGGTAGNGGVGGTAGNGGSATHWTIESVSTGGPGCQDPGSVVVSAEGSSVSLAYAAMELAYPPGAPVQHTSCAVGLSMKVDAGWQLAGGSVAVHGAADLPDGVEARQTTRFFVAGSPDDVSVVNAISGPWSGRYDLTDVIPEASLLWSPCGGSMIFAIDAGLDLQVPAGSQDPSSVALNSVAAGLVWRECQ